MGEVCYDTEPIWILCPSCEILSFTALCILSQLNYVEFRGVYFSITLGCEFFYACLELHPHDSAILLTQLKGDGTWLAIVGLDTDSRYICSGSSK